MFEQIKVQEQTKQAELKAKEAEFKAQAERAAVVSRAACTRCCSSASLSS